MDSDEFTDQLAYYRLYPWGDDWHQAGVISWAAMSGPHVQYRNRTAADFIPKFLRRKPEQTPEQISNVIIGMALEIQAHQRRIRGS